MKISHKLILSIVSITTLVVLISTALARWSFDHGFRDFIYGLEAQRLARISQKVLAQYAQSGGWTQRDAETYAQLLVLNEGGGRPRARPDHLGGPPSGAPDNVGNRPPPPPMEHGDFLPPEHDPAGRPPPNELIHLVHETRRDAHSTRDIGARGSTDGAPPVALLDNHGRVIAGVDPDGIRGFPVSVPLLFQQQRIGELVSWPNVNPDNKLASDFSHQQWLASLVIALSCIAVAALLSWLMAKRLLTPVRAVLSHVDLLAKGHYVLPHVKERADELGQVLQDIAKLGQTLESNRTAKNRWFADISHELRTPLAVMMSEIESLKAGYRAFDEKQLASFEEEVLLLNRLVNDLYQLSLSDVGGLQYHLEPCNMAAIIERCVVGMSTVAMDKQLDIHVNIEPDVMIDADAQRIEQMINNLVTNAIKYTNTHGEIWLSCCKSSDTLQLIIEDTAPGVPAEECDQLFLPLYRRDSSRASRLSGAGLGMAICRNIVQAHQGDIRATPSAHGGLKICVELPAKQER